MARARVVVVVGTRPEAIKLAPLIRRLRAPGAGFEPIVLVSGQHGALLEQALAGFGLRPDDRLHVDLAGASLSRATGLLLASLGDRLAELRPDLVISQGDTTTALVAGQASYYNQVPFAHIEAGLRTGHPFRPFPEELNRVLASHLATLHFAPTPRACANLLREGIPRPSIHLVGNSVIDSLLWVRSLPASAGRPMPEPYILATMHRRENQGAPIRQVCLALRRLASLPDGPGIVLPVHPNPNVRGAILDLLGGHPGILLAPPADYPTFVRWMLHAALIVSDSGGIQEEAPALGKRVLVLRAETERPEAVEAGVASLVGTDEQAVFLALRSALSATPAAGPAVSPYGDGRASDRIARVLSSFLGVPAGADLPLPSPDPIDWPIPPDWSDLVPPLDDSPPAIGQNGPVATLAGEEARR
jgi:UDP-N-acetylglucosamine 2-epimerase (non-hydrolysing)